jgi:hypothetical protein
VQQHLTLRDCITVVLTVMMTVTCITVWNFPGNGKTAELTTCIMMAAAGRALHWHLQHNGLPRRNHTQVMHRAGLFSPIVKLTVQPHRCNQGNERSRG